MARLAQKIVRLARLNYSAARFALREPASAFLLLRMAGWVAALSALVKVLPLPSALRLVAPKVRRGRTAGDPAEAQAELGRLVDLLLAADFWIFTPTCWKRAPVLHRFLALRGIETRILFGVRVEGEDATLSGHAWLEAGGRPLLEAAEPDYKITYRFPA